MGVPAAILLFVSDRPVLSSLQFALATEGYEVFDGAAEGTDPSAAAALVIDRGTLADGLAALGDLRAGGCAAPAMVLATNPCARLRAQAAAEGATVIEKPLFGDELSGAIGALTRIPGRTPRSAARGSPAHR
jgi:DNA-binding response OmpR family regulator